MTNPDYTHLLLVVDRSGSMRSIQDDMNGGIAKMLDEQAELPGILLVDAWTFDDQIEHVAAGLWADDPILRELVQPRGMTALYDGVGKAVSDLGLTFSKLAENERPGKVVVIIVTDGMENSSHEYDQSAVKALLEEQQNKYSWQVAFLGANIDTAAEGAKIGLRKSATSAYLPTEQGVSRAFATTSSLLSGYRSGATSSIDYDES